MHLLRIPKQQKITRSGHWYFLECVRHHWAVPQQLLLLEIVQQKGTVFLDVLPGGVIGESFGVEADNGVHAWPALDRRGRNSQWVVRWSERSTIWMFLEAIRASSSLIGLFSTFFLVAQTPSKICDLSSALSLWLTGFEKTVSGNYCLTFENCIYN